MCDEQPTPRDCDTPMLIRRGARLLSLIAGVFLAGLEVGGAGMARTTDVPLQLVDVVQATIILVVAIRFAVRAGVRRALRADEVA